MADDFKYHIDHVGGLLRPPELREVLRARDAGGATDADVTAAADAAVPDAAREQRRLGLSAIGDGQFRRRHAASVLEDHLAGWSDAPDTITPVVEALARVSELPPGPAPAATLTPTGRLAADESAFLRTVTDRSTVLALPSAGYAAERSYRPGGPYPSPDRLGADLAVIIRAEVRALAAEGVRHVQLFNPGYALAVTADGRDLLRAGGTDPDVLLDRMAAADAASVDALDADEEFRVTLDLTTGGAAPLAGGYHSGAVERLFEAMPLRRYSVEYPAAPAARFPLDLVPAGRVIALGVVDVRTAETETVEALLDRVDGAAETLDIDDIAISTNGGFAPLATAPRQPTPATQHTKLQLVETVARYYWGNEL